MRNDNEETIPTQEEGMQQTCWKSLLLAFRNLLETWAARATLFYSSFLCSTVRQHSFSNAEKGLFSFVTAESCDGCTWAFHSQSPSDFFTLSVVITKVFRKTFFPREVLLFCCWGLLLHHNVSTDREHTNKVGYNCCSLVKRWRQIYDC